MISGKYGIVAMATLLVLFLFVFGAGVASAQGGDPAIRSGGLQSIDVGENGGGDPDNPVPLDGDTGHDEYRSSDGVTSEFDPDLAVDRRGRDDLFVIMRTAVAFLDSLLLI